MRLFALVFGAVLCAAPALAGDKPDVVLKGSISGADNLGYRDLPFSVPAGVRRLTIVFRHSGQEQHAVIDLGLFDNERFRGWSGGDKSEITLSTTDATPSYLIGPIRAGTWHLILGIPNIRKDATADYEADVSFEREGAPLSDLAFSNAPLAKGSRWYRGDLHMHTAQSDGSCESQSGKKVPCPLYKTLEAAAARGLDFIAISDHNTISQFNDERELQPYFDKLLLIPGREITTYRGHANVFGTMDFIDFRLGSPSMPDLNKMLDAVEAAHGLISINHPKLPSGEVCMGCGWSVADTDYKRIRAIEIVNGGATALFSNADNPVSGIPFWEELLNKGYRITAIGGSDNHNGPSTKAPVGYPTTVVHADELSDRAILDGIRKGHAYVEVEGVDNRYKSALVGPRFSVAAFAGSKLLGEMGDAVAAPKGALLTLVVVSPQESIDHSVRLISDGKIVDTKDIPSLKPNRDGFIGGTEFKFLSDGARHWLRIDVRDPQNHLLLIGNPIYLNF
jgi:hypothetical protein